VYQLDPHSADYGHGIGRAWHPSPARARRPLKSQRDTLKLGRKIDRTVRPGGSLIQTTMFAQLAVPEGATRHAELDELDELPRRAAVYATRAPAVTAPARPTSPRGGNTRPGAPASAANRSPPIPTPS
jgi:hypothetical protein